MTTTTTTDPDATKRSSKEAVRRRSLGVVARRRTGKKDRHSKICTAQGVRDRRMRLSLQVARKFFDLQDMLGYDKASKTIEWLFTKSKKAIKDLINDHAALQPNNSDVKSESFLSECEVVSESIHEDNKEPLCVSPKVKDERTKSSSSLKESREKARARAKTRTRQKMMEKCLNPNFQHKLGFSNAPFDGLIFDSSFQHQLGDDVGTIEKFLGNSSSSSWPTSDNNSSGADFMGFFGNWDLLNTTERSSSSVFSVTNQVSLAGNPNDEFP